VDPAAPIHRFELILRRTLVSRSGLAGSVTTFSSWMLEGYEAFADLDGTGRSRLHNVCPHSRSLGSSPFIR
jgi:hypothetical protein